MKIKKYLDDFAVVISDVVNTDVLIVNSKMDIVGSHFKYFSLYNDIKYGTLIADIITNNKPLSIFDKSKAGGCRECPQFHECKMKGFIGVPIHYENKVIGAISLILPKTRTKELFDKLGSTMTFMENMAELVATRMHEHELKKTLKARVERVEAIINAMPEALVYSDCYGNIIHSNKAFDRLFNNENEELRNLKEIYPGIIKLYRKNKNIDNFKLSISTEKYSFYGTVSCDIVDDKDDMLSGFICCFRTYKEIYNNSMIFAMGTMVTFSWLTKYIKNETIEEAKILAENDEDILLKSDDNALNELLAKAIVNYSGRRLGELRVIYMQNVYRDLLFSFFFDEYGVIKRLKKGTLVIVQPEMMSLFIQDKLADYILSNQRKEDDVRFIFCSTSDIDKLVREELFSERLYNLISKNTLYNTETLRNNNFLFTKFIRSGIKYYNKVYNREDEEKSDIIQKKLWENGKNLELGMLELILEKTIRSGSDIYTTESTKDEEELPIYKIEYEQLKKLLLKKKSKKDICRIMGFSRATLYRKIKKYNLEDLIAKHG